MKIKDILISKKINEAIDQPKGPQRIPTGGGSSIANPAYMDSAYYEGDPEGFNFKNQKNNYARLKAALARNGKKLDYIAVAVSAAGPDIFVATGPGIVWYKYVAGSPQGAQNSVYINGTKIALTAFFLSDPAQQDRLLNSSGADIILDKQQDPLKWIKTLVKSKMSASELTKECELKKEKLLQLFSGLIKAQSNIDKAMTPIQNFVKVAEKAGVALPWLSMPAIINYLTPFVINLLGSADFATSHRRKIIPFLEKYNSYEFHISADMVVAKLTENKDQIFERIESSYYAENVIETVTSLKELGVNWPNFSFSYFLKKDPSKLARSVLTHGINIDAAESLIDQCKTEGFDLKPILQNVFKNNIGELILHKLAKSPSYYIPYINEAANLADLIGLKWSDTSVDLSALFEENKVSIIRGLLTQLKQGSSVTSIPQQIKVLKENRISWPELDTILKAVNAAIKQG